MKKDLVIIRSVSFYLFVAFLFTNLYSCGKKDELVEDETFVEEEIPTDANLFYRVNRVENFPAIQGNNTSTEAAPVFYSLESKSVRAASHKNSRNWDIAFGGLFNSFLSGNNGQNSVNYGKGTTSTGGILILEKSFDEVVDIPADNQFKSGADLIGTDDSGDFGQGIGWYLYDFEGTIVRDGQNENQHIAYVLSNGLALKNGTTTTPRTIVVKTAKGHYAKIRMISCYKDMFDMNQWKRSSPKMFFTFEYVMVPKGSAKFEIR